MDWTLLAQDRAKGGALANTVMKVQVS